MKTIEFNPRILGVRESEISQALFLWGMVVETANDTLGELTLLMEYQEEIPIQLFIELVNFNGSDKELALLVYSLKQNSSAFGDMNISKMFDLKILNPSFFEFANTRARLKDQLKEAQRLVSYPLESLYSEESGSFKISEEFNQVVTDHYTVKTSTPEENEMVDKVLTLVDGLNVFIESGIFNINRGIGNLHLLPNLVKFQKGKFVVNPRAITNKRFTARE